MGEVIPSEMEERLPLQAADVLCWHHQRDLARTATAKDRERFARLKGQTPPLPIRWQRDQLEQIADTMMPGNT